MDMSTKYRVTGAILGLKIGQILEANSKDVEASGLLGHSLVLVESGNTPEGEPEGLSDDELGSSAGVTQKTGDTDAEDAADDEQENPDADEPEDAPAQATSRRKKRR